MEFDGGVVYSTQHISDRAVLSERRDVNFQPFSNLKP